MESNISNDLLKTIELEILKCVDRICSTNNIRYYLCGGTLIGAVRHKGFIPWDDDIDIMMPRPDYERFIAILYNSNSPYKALSPNDKGYYYVFSKVIDSRTILKENNYRPIEKMGVYIDVFPLDGMPDDPKKMKKHFHKMNRLRQRINRFCYTKVIFKKNPVSFLKELFALLTNRFFDLKKAQNKYLDLALMYPYDSSSLVYASGGSYGLKDIFPKTCLNEVICLQFEDGYFKSPIGYDVYLKNVYGDYMMLPPEEKRTSHHFFTASYIQNNQR